MGHQHWVDCPKHESEATDGAVESLCLAVLAGSSCLAIHGQLIDNYEVCNAGNSVPSPLLSVTVAESSEKTGKDHDEVCNDSNKDVGTRQSSEKSKIQEQKRCGDRPVDVSCPVHLTVDGLGFIWDILVIGLGYDDLLQAETVTSSHGEVREESKSRDEGGQDVEQAFLLHLV